MRLRWSRRAANQLFEAADYLESARPGAGDGLYAVVDRVVALIKEQPRAFPIEPHATTSGRLASLSVVPYDLMEDFDPATELTLRYRAKAFLRQRARALRNSIPRSAILERSARIVAALLALPAVREAESVALFFPIEGRNEVDLTGLDAELRALNKRIAYPTIDPETRVMTFRFVDDPTALEERGFGFREPSEGAPEASRLDVIVVPALQIDPRGHRVGYGAGYYDRTLPRFSPPARSIGVAFGFQLIPEVPVTEGDVPVSLVVTDDRVIEPAAE